VLLINEAKHGKYIVEPLKCVQYHKNSKQMCAIDMHVQLKKTTYMFSRTAYDGYISRTIGTKYGNFAPDFPYSIPTK
jgi:hypothetical protein